MPSSIELITKYGSENLDEIFMKTSVTAVLEADQSLLKFINASTVMIPDYVIDGLGDYSRKDGFPEGNVEVHWTPYQLTMDRGTSFTIDSMTDEETAGIAFGKLSKEFMRTKVTPEVDAYRLSKLLANAKTEKIIQSDTITEKNVISKFNEDDKVFEDDEISHSECIRFISTEIDTMIKNSPELTKRVTQQDYASPAGLNFTLRMYDDVPLIPVPKQRFKSLYVFHKGRGEDNKLGFTAAEGACDINYLTVHRNAALCIKKHEKIRVFSPDVNQKKDAWAFQYRLYHDIFTTKNKQSGIHASLNGTYTAPEKGTETQTITLDKSNTVEA